ncbi:hypothetical protein MMC25_007832 [Agyrium rufum]|nr:hypothetical protein [Agyrium rufum]
MLDECKGEKFVYALYCYSCLVLTTTVVGDPLDGSITRQILNRKLGDAHERVEPLVLAYRTSLTALLKRRGELADKYMSFENILFEKEEEHGRASDEFEKLREGSDQRLLSERTLQKVEDKLATEWAGNVAWVDILLYGDQNPPDNGLLERDFDGEVWPRAINGTVDQILPQTSTSLLQSLETRLDEQNQRLAKWKQIKEDLVAATATPIKSPQKNFLRSPTKTPSRSPSKSARKLPPGAPASGHQRTQSATDHNMFTKQDSSLTTPRRTPFFKHPIKPNLEPISTPSLPPRQHVRSLSERTRMSIMRMSPEKGLKDPHDQTKVELLRNLSSLPTAEIPVLGQMDSIAESISTSEPMPDPAVEVPTNQIPDRYAALAERTRLSMLSAAKIQRRPSMKPRQSKVYPVNQWEDSSRTQSLTDVMEEVSLHKKLPGMDADYESVFASRPKIGLGIPGESSFVFGGGYGDEDGSHG